MSPGISKFQHFGGFVLAGGSAFLVDLGMLALLTRVFGVSPYVARVLAIQVAMFVSWWINRSVTFAVVAKPTVQEFAKFAAVAWAVQWMNLALYSGLILTWPALPPEAAAAIGTGVAMFVSYFGYKFGVFHKR